MNFRHLILLVGTNPLPCFVVAKSFLMLNKNIKDIWLIHSETNDYQRGTNEFAEKIKEVLISDLEVDTNDINFHFVALENVGSAKDIKENLGEKLVRRLPEPESGIHLDYTGGTKVMAVHTYYVLNEWQGHSCSLSYLDARCFALRDENNNDVYIDKDMRDYVKLSLEQLLKLHKYEILNHSDNNDIVLPQTEQCFFHMIQSGDIKKYLAEKNKLGKQETDINKLVCSPLDDFENNISAISENQTVSRVMQTCLEEIKDITGKNEGLENRLIKEARRQLGGFWLEKYVYKVLESKLREENDISSSNHSRFSIYSNYLIRKKLNDGARNKNKNFELDVIVLYGYQILLLSCAVGHREETIKNKAFEAMHRASQIGGDEARAILVTTMDAFNGKHRVKIVEDDIKTITGSTAEMIKIMGLKDLYEENFWEEVKHLLWG